MFFMAVSNLDVTKEENTVDLHDDNDDDEVIEVL